MNRDLQQGKPERRPRTSRLWSTVAAMAMVFAGTLHAMCQDAAGRAANGAANGAADRGAVGDAPAAARADDWAFGNPAKTAIIRIEGEITPDLSAYFDRKLAAARRFGAEMVVLDIDSPGGRLDTTLKMSSKIRDLEGITTVAFVKDEAISGAAVLALSCDRLYMAPQAKMGDVGIITFDLASFAFRYVEEKAASPLLAHMEGLAVARDRPALLMQAMVNKDLVVHEVKNVESGEVLYVTPKEAQALAGDGEETPWKDLGEVPESTPEKFLTVTGVRAKELGLCDGNVRSLDDLAPVVGGFGEVRRFRWNYVDTTVYVLTRWYVSALLIIVGLIAMYIELSAPGTSVGGMISLLCFGLFFWAYFLEGTAGWLEVLLFVAGVAFILTEIFVIPGFGLTGIGGVLLIGSSLVLAAQDFIVPVSSQQWSQFGNSLLIVGGSAMVIVVGLVVVTKYLNTVPLLDQLALKPPLPVDDDLGAGDFGADETDGDGTSGSDGATGGAGARRAMHPSGVREGDTGTAESLLRPAGKARIGGKRVDVVTDGQFVEPGTPVEVIEISGNRIVVAAQEV